jgi:hypothetical protein
MRTMGNGLAGDGSGVSVVNPAREDLRAAYCEVYVYTMVDAFAPQTASGAKPRRSASSFIIPSRFPHFEHFLRRQLHRVFELIEIPAQPPPRKPGHPLPRFRLALFSPQFFTRIEELPVAWRAVGNVLIVRLALGFFPSRHAPGVVRNDRIARTSLARRVRVSLQYKILDSFLKTVEFLFRCFGLHARILAPLPGFAFKHTWRGPSVGIRRRRRGRPDESGRGRSVKRLRCYIVIEHHALESLWT